MTLVLIFLAMSLFCATLVVAAGMLSSRANRHVETVETYTQRPTLTSAERAPKEIADALD
jgi:hypothetical protein